MERSRERARGERERVCVCRREKKKDRNDLMHTYFLQTALVWLRQWAIAFVKIGFGRGAVYACPCKNMLTLH